MFEKEEIAKRVVNAAYRIHKELGPGLLEKVYEACFEYELRKSGLLVERQTKVPIHYDSIYF
jgi:GxxExxY protein